MNYVISLYSRLMGVETLEGAFNDLGFWNYGYWLPPTTDPKQASKQLMEYLIAKLTPGSRRVLDVAFGKGGSTKRLCEIFGVSQVTGINIAQDQVNFARRKGIRCELRVMDAARLEFEPDTFDAILCMEAAFHFRSRQSFLTDAHKVLTPGGRLVMSDLLFRSGHGLDPEVFPPENEIRSLQEYRELFLMAGFDQDRLSIEQTTQAQLIPHMAHLAQTSGFFTPATLRVETSADRGRASFLVTRLLNIAECVIVVAEKSRHLQEPHGRRA
jgi:SAM-dependent methyltransferase